MGLLVHLKETLGTSVNFRPITEFRRSLLYWLHKAERKKTCKNFPFISHLKQGKE